MHSCLDVILKDHQGRAAKTCNIVCCLVIFHCLQKCKSRRKLWLYWGKMSANVIMWDIWSTNTHSMHKALCCWLTLLVYIRAVNVKHFLDKIDRDINTLHWFLQLIFISLLIYLFFLPKLKHFQKYVFRWICFSSCSFGQSITWRPYMTSLNQAGLKQEGMTDATEEHVSLLQLGVQFCSWPHGSTVMPVLKHKQQRTGMNYQHIILGLKQENFLCWWKNCIYDFQTFYWLTFSG